MRPPLIIRRVEAEREELYIDPVDVLRYRYIRINQFTLSMRDHTPNFKMLELSDESKTLVRETVMQLLDRLAGDGQLSSDAHLEFWVEVPGVRHPRGTFRGGFLMPDSFLCLADYFTAGAEGMLSASEEYAGAADPLDQAWQELFEELFYQIEIFTSQTNVSKGITVELWAGTRRRPEGEWAYAVDRKIELV